ncbi:MAG: DUF4242 domain-containing protein [Actinobacteria bacterium]|nr:DUF4242 domain-containing protein [Actinomycetota bacterium]
MPQFFDQHPLAHASLTEEAVEAMRAQMKAEAPDDFGVRLLSVFVAVNGQGYCLSEAPDVEAVVKSHEAKGYLIDAMDVVQVASLI